MDEALAAVRRADGLMSDQEHGACGWAGTECARSVRRELRTVRAALQAAAVAAEEWKATADLRAERDQANEDADAAARARDEYERQRDDERERRRCAEEQRDAALGRHRGG